MTDKYADMQYTFKEASLFMRFFQSEELERVDKNNKNILKLPIRLVEKSDGKMGVLGFSPRGHFWNYLMDLYDESSTVSIALKFNSFISNSKTHEIGFNLFAFIDPLEERHYGETDTIGIYYISPEKKEWNIKGTIDLGKTQLSYKNTKILFDSEVNGWFRMERGDAWCEKVRQLICKKSASSCASNIKHAPPIYIYFSSRPLIIYPYEYLYASKEGLKCLIENIENEEERRYPKEYKVAFGKLFMEKYVPIFSANRFSNDRTITLVRQFKAPVKRKVLHLVFAVIVLAVGIFGVLYSICSKKGEKYQKVGLD